MKNKSFLFNLLFLFLWQVSFAQQTILSDSNLPIMVISTDIDPDTNAPTDIPDEPKVLGSMQLIYRPDGSRNYLTDSTNESFLNYKGRIGIELRGSSSQALDKNHMASRLFCKMVILTIMLVYWVCPQRMTGF